MAQDWRDKGDEYHECIIELGSGAKLKLTIGLYSEQNLWWASYLVGLGGCALCFSQGTADTLEQAQEACERTARGMFLKALEGLL